MFSHHRNIFANYDSSFLIYIFIQRGAFHLTKFLYIESYVVSKNGKHMLPHILQEINNNKLKLMSVENVDEKRPFSFFARNVLYCNTEVFALELFQYFFRLWCPSLLLHVVIDLHTCSLFYAIFNLSIKLAGW